MSSYGGALSFFFSFFVLFFPSSIHFFAFGRLRSHSGGPAISASKYASTLPYTSGSAHDMPSFTWIRSLGPAIYDALGMPAGIVDLMYITTVKEK